MLTTWQARSRRKHEVVLAELKSNQDVELAKVKAYHDLALAGSKVDDERLARLRDESASLAGLVLQQGEYASGLLKPDQASAELRDKLVESHAILRIQYERLLLTSNSVEVQEAARWVMRAAWNEREVALGRDRKRQRRFGQQSVVKELRAELRIFTIAVRRELGMSEEFLAEFDDWGPGQPTG
ncbi:hypothetical protein ASC77_13065 [Nocardioides sp. Root1257]|nr:hypothetical protein ASC77_13065 [Nocardioides sp. Root1257]KRC45548.1 hypothetical protein ASE24_13070 [Nocardioides sp. Root224]